MSTLKDLMFWKPAVKYHDTKEYEGTLYDWKPGQHILKKDFSVRDIFHPLTHDILFEKDIKVPMRDGVKLMVDVFRPVDSKEKIPAVIAWSPYGKTSGSSARYENLFNFLGLDNKRMSGLQKFEGPDPDYWTAHGYAVVHPDARGVAHSEGDAVLIGTQEGRDGADLVEWIAKQPWCNGKVALSGTSYLTFSQWFIAAEKPEHLVCIQPTEGLTDGYRDIVTVGGISDYVFANVLSDNHEGFQQREDVYKEILNYPFVNHPVWEDKIAKVENIEIPVYMVASYSNILHTDGTFRAWRNISSKNKWLRIHDNLEWQDYYEPQYVEERRKFFDYYLKGIDNGWDKTPIVRYTLHDMEGNNKVNLVDTQFPPSGTKYKKFYLNGLSRLMTDTPAQNDVPASYDSKGTTPQLSFHFTVNKETDFIGYPKAHLYLEADGSDDMDIFVFIQKLDKQLNVLSQYTMPSRNPRILDALELHGGVLKYSGAYAKLRVSRRHIDSKKSTDIIPVQSYDRIEKLLPGQVVEVELALSPMGIKLYEGETIRFMISAVNHNGNVHPGVSGYPGDNSGKHIIHCGGQYASYVQLGILGK